ncbi:MAG: HAMP domain-containing sensor histidine kinase [Bacteroidota bacterium]
MTPKTLLILLIFFCNETIAQSRMDSVQENGQLQQTLLLSRQQQQEQIVQRKQKQLYEEQKMAFVEQEKQLLQLKFEKNQQQLELERNNAEQAAKQIQLQSKVRDYIKDEAIKEQKNELIIKRKWNFYLTVLFFLVMGFASVTYFIQRRTKRLNDVISKQHAELEEMGIVKDTILGVVSHDMRTPVNSLLSFSELLKAGAISEGKMQLYLDQISNTLNQTSATMNNLLNWSSSQMQGFNPNIISFDMALVTEEILEHFIDRAKSKKINIKNDIEIGCLVMADKNMTELILRNLLSNAIKYSSEHENILITAEVLAEKIIVSVSDEGVGMEDEKINFFNKPNKKPLKSTVGTAREKGTGLGLLLCKTFVSLMQGTIHVSKNKNKKGLVFELGLPKPL